MNEGPKERVRAVLVTAQGEMLVIKRVRPGVAPYWVLPGGGVEPEDADREAALLREVHEEIAGTARIAGLLHVLDTAEGAADSRQYFYLARIARWSFEERTGPEFSLPGRGEHILEQIPLTVAGLDGIDLKPEPFAAFLRRALRSDGGLFALPDLRTADR